MKGFIRAENTRLLVGSKIKKIGYRQCEVCRKDVAIYEHQSKEVSICMICEQSKLSHRETQGYLPPNRRELKNVIRQIEHLPIELKNVTFNDYHPKTESQGEAVNLIHEYISGKHSSIVLRGNPGTGKSHLFRCASREIEKQSLKYKENNNLYEVPKIVLFAKVPELMKVIQSSYSKSTSLTEERILNAITVVDYLILDEIGGERSKPDPNGFETWSGDILYQILDRRQCCFNMYNTNYSSNDLKKKYGQVQGERILSRMFHNAKTLKIDGPDHRIRYLV